ncbi:hypothetical protein BDZ94DRAFT_1312920 [Collybia nuda]|uniref:Peroxin/Ferlin domain-containing protein n=1 Tax=Collybia nuda TaxID=64659 RepID=A0A9P5XXD8_9AGAR|nr:hypothetical protein BDZ94DRAFT_1312920 [Collybia nuda]
MASLAYISVPSSATRLVGPPSSGIRPVQRILTSLPTPSPSPSPGPTLPPGRHRSSSSVSTIASLTSPTSTTFSILPQMLLSSTLGAGSFPSSADETPGDGKLLTTRVGLSLPTTTNNFKRFVAKSGPIFWFQDRVEEIVMWRRGWRVTGMWMAAYAFLCYYPLLVFLIPHLTLISIILASYPYPHPNTHAPPTQAPQSDSVNWPANLQAIQNLMGFVADTHDFIQPYTQHLQLSPAHFPNAPPERKMYKHTRHPSHSASVPMAFPPPSSPYPPYILLLLVLSFFPLLLVVASPLFPARLVCLVAGLAPLVATCPPVRRLWVHAPTIGWAVLGWSVHAVRLGKRRLIAAKHKIVFWQKWAEIPGEVEEEEQKPLLTVLERILDDDRLSDKCWRAEMREVELWENERRGSPASNHTEDHDQHEHTPSSPTRSTPVPRQGPTQSGAPVTEGWSKTNLRPGERTPWTRGRDGWGGVGSGKGAVRSVSFVFLYLLPLFTHSTSFQFILPPSLPLINSNLTFSLAPGWAFVTTEGWRKDRSAAWAGVSSVHSNEDDGEGDHTDHSPSNEESARDGWVYTNDAWGDPHLAPYPGNGGSGSVTRRRRWVRRVYFESRKDGVGA